MTDNRTELQKYFDSQGIAQNEVAKRVGRSVTYVNDLIRGRTRFGRKTASQWSAEFGLNETWLMTGEGPMTKGTPVSEPQQGTVQSSQQPCRGYDMVVENNATHIVNSGKDVPNASAIELMQTMAEMNKQMLSMVTHMVDEQRQATKKMMDLYDQMHMMQNEHNRASREHLNESIAELRRLRQDTFDKIDMLARESKRVLDENKLAIIKD